GVRALSVALLHGGSGVHRLVVGLPGPVVVLELRRDVGGIGLMGAAHRADVLAGFVEVVVGIAEPELAGIGAVVLGLAVGRLAAGHGDVVVEARVPGAVVVGQEGALAGQGAGQVRRRYLAETERGVDAAVLKDDRPDVGEGGRALGLGRFGAR